MPIIQNKVLFIVPSIPYSYADGNRFSCLAEHGIIGDVIVGWGADSTDANIVKLINHAHQTTKNFKYHIFLSKNKSPLYKSIVKPIYYFIKGITLGLTGKHDAIVSYGTNCSGLIALIISYILKIPVIVVVAGNPYAKCESMFHIVTPFNRFKTHIHQIISGLIINNADHLHLLYPSQVKLGKRYKYKTSVFHDYASVESLVPSGNYQNYLLFLGYPWYLKGVDILISAFNSISFEYPYIKLKIVGLCEDKQFYKTLINGNTNIELLDPVYFNEAMELMDNCLAFILPSRTEAMGRVLIEAMSFEKPIIASNVDGIPYIIRDGYNGLLFENEDVNDLADKLKNILSNPVIAKQLAKNGYEFKNKYLTPEIYGCLFAEMLQKTLDDHHRLKHNKGIA